ncbi:hypothetical protein BDV38DRAFT_249730 [Aspergillus pseudotamarii]|uniref:Uncharacterized protein n=1 Tax=Aspergillus pseudotamarii TaxID=132259 RepID=A0A5N6SR26_ASPPS|nr:uncharacterized protein BDV38DRAFT_249730 [Aspergillus pseudotamarii]KAE8136269.1 hypothetical protein BDV38DRAFT_249730 [Aspergillus pseudotamarii]
MIFKFKVALKLKFYWIECEKARQTRALKVWGKMKDHVMGYDVYVLGFLVLIIFRRLHTYVHVHGFSLSIHTLPLVTTTVSYGFWDLPITFSP